jgi:hypothetical protein
MDPEIQAVKMNLKTSLVLMFLFMGLGSVAFFDPFRLEEKKSREEEEKQLLPIKEKVVNEISIKNGARSVKIACAAAEGCKLDGEANWKVTEPVADTGDTSAITTLANAVVNLRSIEKVPLDAPMDPKEFGFEQGKPTLEIRTKDGIFQLETGAPTAVGPNIYVRKPGENQMVYVVAAYFPQMLDKDVFHWRNKRIFPGLEAEKVSELGWKGREVSLKARKENGKWQIESPIKAPANFVMLEGLASTLAYVTAQGILEKGAGKPELEIEFSGGKIALAPKPGPAKGARELVASANGKFFLVDAAPFDRFRKGMLEYRERRLFPDLGQVTELELSFPRENKRIQLKKAAAWAAEGGDKPAEELSQQRINALAEALAQGEASAFLPAANPGARQYRQHKPDLEVALPGGRKASFLIAERKMALTEGVLPGEVRAFTGPFLAALPIRFEDLYASHNKLAPQLKKEEDGHDHSHHGHDH